jgi:DNA-directed RNA polymerase specialized sigma24 family protein
MLAINEMLNTSEGSIKSCLVRATRKLRSHLAHYATSQVEFPS